MYKEQVKLLMGAYRCNVMEQLERSLNIIKVVWHDFCRWLVGSIVSVVHDMHVACIAEESLTSLAKQGCYHCLQSLQCMQCVLSQCMTFGIVVIPSSQCD